MMRVLDYVRLGFAGVKAHKKRAFTVVAIVGLLFSVVVAGILILQGLENAVLAEMLAPTGGKVLVMSSVETKICGENCDIRAEVAEIKKNVEKYGGEVIAAEAVQMADGMFYRLGGGLFKDADDVGGATQVMVTLTTAAKLANVKLPTQDANVASKLRAVAKVREEALRKVVESSTGEKYYIAGILPGGVYANDLSLRNLGQGTGPLDVVLGQIRTGVSQDFIIGNGAMEQLAGFASTEEIDAEDMGLVFALFPDVRAAHSYYQDEANYCSEMDRVFGICSKNYKYQVVSAISNPLETYEALQNIWLVFKVVAAVLTVIALVIALSTYLRLIGKDVRIIALYHSMGATGWQVRAVYAVYLLMLSLMAVIFAMVVGLILAVVLSLVNMEALGQMFVLGFGAVEGEVWLVGWNWLIGALAAAMMLVAVLAVVLSRGSFRAGELARKMK